MPQYHQMHEATHPGRIFLLFFFSSRRRHTRFDCDWSSDVCSSDLSAVTFWFGRSIIGMAMLLAAVMLPIARRKKSPQGVEDWPEGTPIAAAQPRDKRSEERRVGKECRSRWSPYH